MSGYPARLRLLRAWAMHGLRRPMIVSFAAKFSVAIGQITVGFFAIDRLQLEPEPAAQAAWLRRMARPSVNPIGSTMLGAFLRSAPRALLAHRHPAHGAGAAPFALSCQTALSFSGRSRSKAKKNPLAQQILFFLFGAAQAGPPDRGLPEADRPAPLGAVISKRR